MKVNLHIHRGPRQHIYPYVYQQCRCGALRTRNPQRRRDPVDPVLANWPVPVDQDGYPTRSSGWVHPEEG